MSTQYTTTSVMASRRFDYWNDVVCRHCIPAASNQLTAGPFDAQLATRSIGAIDINAMSAPRHRWTRTTRHLRSAAEDDLWLAYMQSGDGGVDQAGAQARLRSGDLVLYDAARPFQFTLTSKSIYLVRLPRQALLQSCPQAQSLVARVLDSTKPGCTALRSLILQAASADFGDAPPGTTDRFGDTLLNLTSMVLEFQMTAGAAVVEHDLYSRLIAYIHGHFRDPELNVTTLAAAQKVSVRTVTRAFARHDQTALGVIWRLRLEASRQALAEGRSRSVTEAAFDHGFTDLSHFSRAFRKAYGHAPRTLLRDH